MPKDLNTDFDAQAFLDSFEEEGKPKRRKAKTGSEKSPPAELPPETPEMDYRDVIAKTPISNTRSDKEEDYLHSFVLDCPINTFYKKGRQVVVVNEQRRKILKILALFGEDEGNIARYVYNVLEHHFKEFDPIIQGLFRKCRQI